MAKIALLKIGRPAPNVVVPGVEVGCLARHPPLLPERHRDEAPPPPTQVLRPALFADADTHHTPLKQRVPPDDASMWDKLTNTEAQIVTYAIADAKEHVSKRQIGKRQTWFDKYSTATVVAFIRRFAKAIPTKPAGKVESEDRQRDAREHQRELAFDFFRRVPRESGLVSRKKLRAEDKHIAKAIAVAFAYSSEDQALRNVAAWRNEFLRSQSATTK